MRRMAAALAAAALLFTACSGGAPRQAAPAPPVTATQPPTTPVPTAPTTTTLPYQVHHVAIAEVARVAAYDRPDGEVTAAFANPNPTFGTPRVFLVQEEAGDWLEVLLPMRPNGSTGWIRRSDVSLDSHDFRIVVSLSARQLTVYEKDTVFLQEPVAIGTGATPTPGGVFYTTELLTPVGQPEYGPYAFGLSGYSEVLYDFAGGDGQLGIHGTNDPSSIGRSASNGCIRMHNDAITKMAERLPIGVPVEITA